ncbi:unnamed protein product [Didymodactylos carnosus]|uniref:Uncharacterized protein n=1 Tax=Didymodactylos carnosus TaxID=1234261 RepID=A0A8S2F298_9BILA|nr:unnamed protein product [Didymodactylos carnosus]CAF4185305.1 unnamed protein product [Didymodactylos carnosus]
MKPSEKYRNILQENIKAGAEIKFDLQWILNQNEISIFNGYKRVGANKDILFYGMLPLLSRFAQASIYASMFEESKPLNLYSITIGPPVCTLPALSQPELESCFRLSTQKCTSVCQTI